MTNHSTTRLHNGTAANAPSSYGGLQAPRRIGAWRCTSWHAPSSRALFPTASHTHAPQVTFINGFFIVARSSNVRSPLLVRQAQWQWRSTREGRARKGRGERSLSGKKGMLRRAATRTRAPHTPALM